MGRRTVCAGMIILQRNFVGMGTEFTEHETAKFKGERNIDWEWFTEKNSSKQNDLHRIITARGGKETDEASWVNVNQRKKEE